MTSPGHADGAAAGVAGERGAGAAGHVAGDDRGGAADAQWGEPGPSIEVLQIRLADGPGLAPASWSGCWRWATRPPGLLRGQFQFCGAGRTGRWSGRGVQVQNLPRVPKGFSPDLFAEMAAKLTAPVAGALDAVAPAPVLDCVCWSLRSCLKATDDQGAVVVRLLADRGPRAGVAGGAAGHPRGVRVRARTSTSGRRSSSAPRTGNWARCWSWRSGSAWGRRSSGTPPARLRRGADGGAGRDSSRAAGGSSNRHDRAVLGRDGSGGEVAAILRRAGCIAVGGSGVAFTCTARTLQMRLPSGRVLYYHKPRIDRDTGSIVYWGAEVGGRWVEQRTWGGKLAENATQAAARDIMAEAMLRAWRRKALVPCMTVHDELVYAVRARRQGIPEGYDAGSAAVGGRIAAGRGGQDDAAIWCELPIGSSCQISLRGRVCRLPDIKRNGLRVGDAKAGNDSTATHLTLTKKKADLTSDTIVTQHMRSEGSSKRFFADHGTSRDIRQSQPHRHTPVIDRAAGPRAGLLLVDCGVSAWICRHQPRGRRADSRALVIDDVGTKVPSEGAVLLALGEPTTIVETFGRQFPVGLPVVETSRDRGLERLLWRGRSSDRAHVPLEARSAQTLMRLPMGRQHQAGPGQLRGAAGGTVKPGQVELNPDTITQDPRRQGPDPQDGKARAPDQGHKKAYAAGP